MSLKVKFVTGLIIVLVLTTLGVSGAIFRSMYVDVMAQTEVSMRAQAERSPQQYAWRTARHLTRSPS